MAKKGHIDLECSIRVSTAAALVHSEQPLLVTLTLSDDIIEREKDSEREGEQ